MNAPNSRAELAELLKQLQSDAESEKKVTELGNKIDRLERSLSNEYVKKEPLDKMIWNRIKQNEENKKEVSDAVEKANAKNDKNKLNWTVILQLLITAIIISVITAYIASKVK